MEKSAVVTMMTRLKRTVLHSLVPACSRESFLGLFIKLLPAALRVRFHDCVPRATTDGTKL